MLMVVPSGMTKLEMSRRLPIFSEQSRAIGRAPILLEVEKAITVAGIAILKKRKIGIFAKNFVSVE